MNADPATLPTDPRLIHLAPEDNLCAVTTTLEPGQTLLFQGRPVSIRERIPTGHKVCVAPIAAGQKVRKHGAPIGSATCDIEPGQYVHTHNVKSDYLPTFSREDAAAG
jgi:hypothetical protein